MTICYNQEEFVIGKYVDKFPLKCKECNNSFMLEKKYILRGLRKTHKNATYEFCSLKCKHSAQIKRILCECGTCGIHFLKLPNQIKKSKQNFCSSSCAAIYNNAHKSYGIRRSKIELFLEQKLREVFPNLEIIFNRKTDIFSELDIFIPSLKLAFELNGICHYKPIYGLYKFIQIKNNDKRKIKLCLEHNIELHIIDISSQKKFTEKTSEVFLNFIIKILSVHLSI